MGKKESGIFGKKLKKNAIQTLKIPFQNVFLWNKKVIPLIKINIFNKIRTTWYKSVFLYIMKKPTIKDRIDVNKKENCLI